MLSVDLIKGNEMSACGEGWDDEVCVWACGLARQIGTFFLAFMNVVFVFFQCQRMSNTTQHYTHSLTPQTHFPLFWELYYSFPTLLYTLHLCYYIQNRSIKPLYFKKSSETLQQKMNDGIYMVCSEGRKPVAIIMISRVAYD